jgi:hypothetical protein
MNCEICGKAIHNEKPLNILDKTYTLCIWCLGRINAYIHGNVHHNVINILWGAGRIGREWYNIRDLIRKNNIEDILEFGTGLSTELFVIEGIPLVTFDTLFNHVELYKKLELTKGKAEFYYYEPRTIPDFDLLFPNRKWDMVFVDGPHERSREVRAAMKLAKRFIYLHDPNLGEQDFFPDDNWESTNDSKLFRRKETK